MARLPEPGGDKGTWGDVLNSFLSVAHNDNGTLKDVGLLADKYTLPSDGIPESDLSDDVQAKLNAAANDDITDIAGLSPANDDLLQRKAGAWTNRTLAQVKSDLGLGNVDNTSDTSKNSASATLTNKTISADNNTITNLSTTNFASNIIDTDDTLAADSDTRLASQQATKAYVDNTVSATVAEDVSVIAATGVTETLSWNIPMHDITLDQNCTVSFSNIAAGKSITVVVRGSFTLDWPATVKWPDLTEPDYTGPAIYTFMSTDGSEVFGFQAGFTMGTA